MNTPKIHTAPLQGITDSVWRNAHAHHFGGIDYYHAPFMRVDHGECRKRDLRDVDPSHNRLPLVPQILGGRPDEVLTMARALREMGYRLVEINLGCPHPPVALKHRGSGLLAFPTELETMCESLSTVESMAFSVKMRLGWGSETQWRDALSAMAALAPKYITVHPRIGKQQYKGELYLDQWEQLLGVSPYPVVFNGDITSKEQIDQLTAHYPNLAGIMIGRGIIAWPSLTSIENYSRECYTAFHKELVEGYSTRLEGGEHQLLTRMKSLWAYFMNDADRRLLKPIIKSRTMNQYNEACQRLFDNYFHD